MKKLLIILVVILMAQFNSLKSAGFQEGQYCLADSQCLYGHCRGGGISRACQFAPLSKGSYCALDSDCQSNHCKYTADLGNNICQ